MENGVAAVTDQPDPPLARCACGVEGRFNENRTGYGWLIGCRGPFHACGARTPRYPTCAEAIAAWNRMQGVDDANSLLIEAVEQLNTATSNADDLGLTQDGARHHDLSKRICTFLEVIRGQQ